MKSKLYGTLTLWYTLSRVIHSPQSLAVPWTCPVSVSVRWCSSYVWTWKRRGNVELHHDTPTAPWKPLGPCQTQSESTSQTDREKVCMEGALCTCMKIRNEEYIKSCRIWLIGSRFFAICLLRSHLPNHILRYLYGTYQPDYQPDYRCTYCRRGDKKVAPQAHVRATTGRGGQGQQFVEHLCLVCVCVCGILWFWEVHKPRSVTWIWMYKYIQQQNSALYRKLLNTPFDRPLYKNYVYKESFFTTSYDHTRL